MYQENKHMHRLISNVVIHALSKIVLKELKQTHNISKIRVKYMPVIVAKYMKQWNGLCFYDKDTIVINPSNTWVKIVDTICHELAHWFDPTPQCKHSLDVKHGIEHGDKRAIAEYFFDSREKNAFAVESAVSIRARSKVRFILFAKHKKHHDRNARTRKIAQTY